MMNTPFLRVALNLSMWIQALVFLVFVWGLMDLMLIFTTIESPSKLIEEFSSNKSLFEDQRDGLISDIETMVNETIVSNNITPAIEYEQLRRRVRSNVLELYNYFGSELEKIRKKNTTELQLGNYLNKVIQMTTEHKRSLIKDLDYLQKIDGYEQWRRTEAENLGNLVQRRLKYIQNPKDCSTARKLVCQIQNKCGFGCQLHHLGHCLIMAYATKRTLILKSKGWRYHQNGWEEVFKPLSDTCTTTEGTSHANWGDSDYNDTQVVDLPTIGLMHPQPPQIPMAIPDDLAARVKRLHGDPFAWWLGQIFKYLLRFQPKTQEIIDAAINKLGLRSPIVGVHIRRTDKLVREAALHEIDEYMRHVDEYYNQLEMVETVEKRRVFLASDDPKVIDEARMKYPQYEIIGNLQGSHMADLSTRYTDPSLYGIIFDTHMLSLSDYLVCTFSSNVGRMAYAKMQTMHPDASNRFKSLDSIFFFDGERYSVAHKREAVLPHHSMNKGEIDMNVGDLIAAYNPWEALGGGYLFGQNIRTNQVGSFPSFKVVDTVETAEFPKYSNIQET